MRTKAEVEAELKRLKEEREKYNNPFFHKDELAVLYAIHKLEWVLGNNNKDVKNG